MEEYNIFHNTNRMYNKNTDIKIPEIIDQKLNIIIAYLHQFIFDNINNIQLLDLKLKTITEYIKNETINKNISDNNCSKQKIIKFSNFLRSYSNKKTPTASTISYKLKFPNEKITDINAKKQGYLILKLKKKLKKQNENFNIKELDYLEKVALLQGKLHIYQDSFKKLINENNNEDESNTNKKIINSYMNGKLSNSCNSVKGLKRPQSQYNKRYIDSNKSLKNANNSENIKNKARNSIIFSGNPLKGHETYTNLKDLHYKYETGNKLIVRDFEKTKKTIKDNFYKIQLIKKSI